MSFVENLAQNFLKQQAQSDLWAATIYKLMHQMKTILTELPMYGYWPGSVFMHVRGIEVCVRVGCACGVWVCMWGVGVRVVWVCVWCMCVWGVCACGVCVRVGCECTCGVCVCVWCVWLSVRVWAHERACVCVFFFRGVRNNALL